MENTKLSDEAAGQSGRLPKDLDDTSLKQQLAGIQSRTRRLMSEHGIASGDMVSMARDSARAITDDARRAEFLTLLIELQEFGGEAKRRGLLRSPVPSRAAVAKEKEKEQPQKPMPAATAERETGLFDSDREAGDEVDEVAARDFFNKLDD